jgi:transposase
MGEPAPLPSWPYAVQRAGEPTDQLADYHQLEQDVTDASQDFTPPSASSVKYITNHDVRRMAVLRANGFSKAAIARKLGVSVSTVCRYLGSPDLTKARDGRAERALAMTAMRHAGKSWSAIARKFNCHSSTVRYWVDEQFRARQMEDMREAVRRRKATLEGKK